MPSCKTQRRAGRTSRCPRRRHIGPQPWRCTACRHSPLAGRQHTRGHFTQLVRPLGPHNRLQTRRATGWRYLTGAVDADAVVLGVAAEGAVLSWHEQLPLAADGRALQVTGFAGDADVISCKKQADVSLLELLGWRTSTLLPAAKPCRPAREERRRQTYLDKVASTGNTFCQTLLR